MALTITKEPVNPCFSKNIIAFQVQTDTTLAVKARVFFETAPYSDTYEFLVEIKAIPDSDGYCVFYLHGLLESDVLVYDRPNFASVAQVMQTGCRRFKVDFYEYDSTALVLHDQFTAQFNIQSFEQMTVGTDYVIITDTERSQITLRPDIISGQIENYNLLYELDGQYWFYIENPSYAHDLIGANIGDSFIIYEGTPPTLVTSSVRFSILGGIEYERFNLLTENYLLWGDENYDLIIDSNGNFIGVS